MLNRWTAKLSNQTLIGSKSDCVSFVCVIRFSFFVICLDQAFFWGVHLYEIRFKYGLILYLAGLCKFAPDVRISSQLEDITWARSLLRMSAALIEM